MSVENNDNNKRSNYFLRIWEPDMFLLSQKAELVLTCGS